eukprot:1142033-Pelagomonas_calceolata.AAC.2
MGWHALSAAGDFSSTKHAARAGQHSAFLRHHRVQRPVSSKGRVSPNATFDRCEKAWECAGQLSCSMASFPKTGCSYPCRAAPLASNFGTKESPTGLSGASCTLNEWTLELEMNEWTMVRCAHPSHPGHPMQRQAHVHNIA